MKIEIGESLGYSYLRHVKQCWLVQTNWKVSEHWVKHISDDDLEMRFQAMRDTFDLDGTVFKGTKNCGQLLKQGEIDVVGVSVDGSVHTMEVAYHEGGLNYGGGADNRVLKKLLRSLLLMSAYLPAGTQKHIYLASPKVYPKVQEKLEGIFSLLKDAYPGIDWQLLVNQDFADLFLYPTLQRSESVADTTELFVRSVKLLNLFDSGETG